MKKLLIVFFTLLIPFFFPKAAQAGTITSSNVSFNPQTIYLDEEDSKSVTVTISNSEDLLVPTATYYIEFEGKWGDPETERKTYSGSGNLTFTQTFDTISDDDYRPKGSKHLAKAYKHVAADVVLTREKDGWDDQMYKAPEKLHIYRNSETTSCNFKTAPAATITIVDPIFVEVTDLEPGTKYRIVVSKAVDFTPKIKNVTANADGSATASFEPIDQKGNYKITVETHMDDVGVLSILCSYSFKISDTPIDSPSESGGSTIDATHPKPCTTKDGKDGIQTAIGCIPTDTGDFISYLLTRAVSVGGGLAFLIMLAGAFTLLTSGGNPETLQKGKETIVSALIGLIFIIFSIYLLKFIGVDILNLSEFTTPSGGGGSGSILIPKRR